MSNKLAVSEVEAAVPAVLATSQESLGLLSTMSKSTKGFLSRVQLYTKGKAINHGLVMPGEYGIAESEDQITRLGKSMDVVPLAFRAKAIDLSDTDSIVSSFDLNSDEFKRIQDASTTENSGCMWGPSFLFFERSTERFLEWFCNNDSARREAGKVGPFLPKDGQVHAMTMGSRVAEKKTYSWHVPTIAECSTPIKLPPADEVAREIERFLNPPKASAEKATTEEAAAASRRAR